MAYMAMACIVGLYMLMAFVVMGGIVMAQIAAEAEALHVDEAEFDQP